MAATLLIFNGHQYKNGFSTATAKSTPDLILCYPVECFYGETNRVYTRAEKLEVREKDYTRMITYSDIGTIAALEGVEKVILLDTEKFYGDFWEATQKPVFMSFPKVISVNFAEIHLVNLYCLLETGAYPADNAREVCLAKDIVTDHYKLEPDKAIGQKIKYQGEWYDITGVLDNYDSFCLMSFNTEDDQSFYEYSQETWDNYRETIDEDSTMREILIYTSPNKETNVLNKLISTFPAHNYDSHYFRTKWVEEYNKFFLLKQILPFNFGAAMFMGIIVFFVRKQHLILNRGLLRDYANYYLDETAPTNVYSLTVVLTFLTVLLLSIAANFLYSPYAFASTSILVIDLIVAFVPSFVYTLFRIRHAV